MSKPNELELPSGMMVIQFSPVILEQYLQDRKKTNYEELTTQEREELFVIIAKGFYSGENDLDDLSGNCEVLWSTMGEERSGHHLGSLLLAASELSYLVRAIGDDDENSTASKYLKTTLSSIKSFLREKSRLKQ